MSVSQISETAKYVTFVLDQETYALDINQVREVLEFTKVTRVPQMPDFVRGVINLRGNVVPVVDLKSKFRIGKTEKSINARIIIVEVAAEGEPLVIGALADSVHDVVELESDEISPPPKIGTRLSAEFIRGMGQRSGDFIIILDADRVFTTEDIDEVAGLQNQSLSQESGTEINL